MRHGSDLPEARALRPRQQDQVGNVTPDTFRQDRGAEARDGLGRWPAQDVQPMLCDVEVAGSGVVDISQHGARLLGSAGQQ